jgi:1,4-dihydroxy-2-naphthoyl-CoA hydrolase
MSPPEVRIEGLPLEAGELLGAGGGFVQRLGLVIDLVSPTRAEGHLDAGADHHQVYGMVHGGVLTAIVETLASVGAGANVAERGMQAVGVANQTDFIRPHRTGRLEAVAEPIHPGRNQQLWVVEITRASDGKLVARGQVRLQVVAVDDLG